MPRVLNELQARSRYRLLELPAALVRDPAVLAPPEDARGAAYLSEQRRDLVGVLLIHLCDLAVEGGLSDGAEPGVDVEPHVLRGQGAEDGAGNVGRQDCGMDVGREPGERLLVITHVAHERRAPGRNRHRIEERERTVVAAM